MNAAVSTAKAAVAGLFLACMLAVALGGDVAGQDAPTDRPLTFSAHCPPCPSPEAAIEIYDGAGELAERIRCACGEAPATPPGETPPPIPADPRIVRVEVPGEFESSGTCSTPGVGPRPADPHLRCPGQVHRFTANIPRGRYLALRVEFLWQPPADGCRSQAGPAKCAAGWFVADGSNRDQSGYLFSDGKGWTLRWGWIEGQSNKAKRDGRGVRPGRWHRVVLTAFARSFGGDAAGTVELAVSDVESGAELFTAEGEPGACAAGATPCFPAAFDVERSLDLDAGFDGFHPGEGVGGRVKGVVFSALRGET